MRTTFAVSATSSAFGALGVMSVRSPEQNIAPPSSAYLAQMLLSDGMVLVTVGMMVGLAAAVNATRFLRSLLYEVTPTSVAEFALATALLAVVTLVATLLPARQAAGTSPAVVLRGE
jgi:putative ABC transport system permease protein